MLSKGQLKYIQSLAQKKRREEERVFIAEGPKVIQEFLADRSVRIKKLFALKEWLNKHSLPPEIEVMEIDQSELERISFLQTPNQVLAIVDQFGPPDIIISGRITLGLDRIQDPGNLGTIIRVADWFGVDQIICSPDCADIYNPKVIQSSMGSIVRVRIKYQDIGELIDSNNSMRIFATTLEGKDIRTHGKIREGLILIGNESQGIHSDLLARANVRLTIPGKGKAESLNAAIAAGIILSHIT